MQTQTATLPAPRHDLYGTVHKGLRHFMSETLVRVGSIDLDDLASAVTTLDQLRRLVRTLAHHLTIEDRFVLPAIEARWPGATTSNAHEHRDHERAFDALTDQAAALQRAIAGRDVERARLATQLYIDLSRFVADNLLHMIVEETENNARLWEAYTDDELRALNGAILAWETPEQLAYGLRWLVQALAPIERAFLVAGARPSVPPPVFDHLLAFIREALPADDWAKLAATFPA